MLHPPEARSLARSVRKLRDLTDCLQDDMDRVHGHRVPPPMPLHMPLLPHHNALVYFFFLPLPFSFFGSAAAVPGFWIFSVL
mmetsp:Transcript_9298/g.20946  ORF Transcript_9298/g.20946 Transcript_9298/m.20946 type:complete len:82 (-) Transcript_9298:2024-2269(-)